MEWFSKLKNLVLKIYRLFIRGNLTVRYIFALGLIASLSFILQLIIQSTLDHQKNHLETIQKARHHLDSIRPLKNSLYVLQSEARPSKINPGLQTLISQLDLFLAEASDFWNEDGQKNMVEKFGQEKSQYQGPILEVFHHLKADREELQALGATNRSKLVRPIFQISEHLKSYQDLTSLELQRYDSALSKRLDRLRQFELLIFVITLLVLLFEALFIFRPAILKLNKDLQIRSDFFGRIGHEIKNPMNSILGMAELMEQTPLNKIQQMHLNRLKKSAEGLLQFLTNVIEFSGIEQKKVQVNLEKVELQNLLDEALAQISFDALKKGLSFYVYMDLTMPQQVHSDYLKIKHIILNLLGNAIKFTEKGHIALKMRIKEKALMFEVEDSGIGISKDQQKNIFDCFVQADSSIKRKHGGTGLGLAIVREYLDLLHGHIDLESDLGKGSRFQVSIPVGLVEEAKPLENKFLQFDRVVTIGGHELNRWALFHLLGHHRPHQHYLLHEQVSFEALGPKTLVLIESIEAEYFQKIKKLAGKDFFFHLVGATHWSVLAELPQDMQFVYPLILTQLQTEKTMEKANPLPYSTPPVEAALPPVRALICDDSADNRLILQTFLRKLGVESQGVENCHELLTKLQVEDFDITFLDIEMPEMDGPTLLEKIRKSPETYRPTKFVAFTGHDPALHPEKFGSFPSEHVLIKPITLESVDKILKKAAVLPKTSAPKVLSDFEKKVRERLLKKRPFFIQQKNEEMQALNVHDFEGLKFFGHKLKGSSAHYGYDSLSEWGKELEDCAVSGEEIKCQELVGKIKHFIEGEVGRLEH